MGIKVRTLRFVLASSIHENLTARKTVRGKKTKENLNYLAESHEQCASSSCCLNRHDDDISFDRSVTLIPYLVFIPCRD